MTARDFSVRHVLVLRPDGTLAEKESLPRAVRDRGSLKVGSFCDVEFGATWATEGGRKRPVPGTYYQCRVVTPLKIDGEAQTVFVVLDPQINRPMKTSE